jgi:hypothetical protein
MSSEYFLFMRVSNVSGKSKFRNIKQHIFTFVLSDYKIWNLTVKEKGYVLSHLVDVCFKWKIYRHTHTHTHTHTRTRTRTLTTHHIQLQELEKFLLTPWVRTKMNMSSEKKKSLFFYKDFPWIGGVVTWRGLYKQKKKKKVDAVSDLTLELAVSEYHLAS